MRAPIAIVACLCLWLTLAAGAAEARRTAPLHWSAPVTLPGSYGVFSLACPSSALCVAGTSGDLLVSTDPTGGASAWIPSAAPPQRPGFGAAVHGVACEPSAKCVAVALSSQTQRGTAAPRDGVIAVSSDPTGGARAWRVHRLHDVADYAYCLAQECALATEDGDILTARHPAAGARAWHSVHQLGAGGHVTMIPALACATADSCLAPIGGVLRLGEIIGSLRSRRAFSWRYTQGFGGAPDAAPSGADCVPGLCAFAASVDSGLHGGYGEVLTTARLGGRWSVTRYPASKTAVVSCASASFCVAGGIDQQVRACRPGPSCVSPPPTGVIIVGKP